MTSHLKILYQLALFVLPFHVLLAQQEQDNDYYFDDGGLSNRKNNINVNIASFLARDIALFYERALSKSFSVELGAGLLLPVNGKELQSFISDPIDLSESKGGYSLWFQPKYYLKKEMFEYGVIGLQLRQRNYNIKSAPELTYTDINLIYGSQLLLGKHFMIGTSFGIGFKLKTEPQSDIKHEIHGISMPISIKTGIIF